VSLQTHLTCFPEPVLELENKFIQEGDLKLITLQGAVPPQEVYLLLLPLNVCSETIALSSSGESERENMGSDPKMLTAPRVTISRLSSKKVFSLKLPTALPVSILEETASTMSWDDHVSA